jgi:hypothetical protein
MPVKFICDTCGTEGDDPDYEEFEGWEDYSMETIRVQLAPCDVETMIFCKVAKEGELLSCEKQYIKDNNLIFNDINYRWVVGEE